MPAPTESELRIRLGTLELQQFGLSVDELMTNVTTTGGVTNIVIKIPDEYFKNRSDAEIRAFQDLTRNSINAISGGSQMSVVFSTHSNIDVTDVNRAANSNPQPLRGMPAQAKTPEQKQKAAKKTVLIHSPKEGEGRSTITWEMAFFLAMESGKKAALFDGAVRSPTFHRVPDKFKMREYSEAGMVKPQLDNGMPIFSPAFALGAHALSDIHAHKAGELIREGVQRFDFGSDLEFLVVDTPAGDGEELKALRESLDIDGALVITTPQEASLETTERSLIAMKNMDIPVLGLVENMAPMARADDYNPITSGPADDYDYDPDAIKKMANGHDVEFMGAVPKDPALLKASKEGKSVFQTEPKAPSSVALRGIGSKLRFSLI